MNFGLKLWSTNQDTLPQAEQLIKDDVFQYIELTPIPGTEIDTFLSYDLPYTIHITTERHGVNIADREKRDYNIKTIQNCIEWADQLNARYIILHPGFGSMASSREFLECIDDKRTLIENMPKVGLFDEAMVGYSPEQISELMGSKFGFCFDMNHAIKAAVSLNGDYKEYIKDFLKLNPSYFHISDGNLANEKDEHLSIGEGNYDFEFLMQYVSSIFSKYITLETPRSNLESFNEDLANLTKIKAFIK
ncbi:MAG: TIM barrel protein [Methanosarcina sp.]|uniref:sugar phosphate isomerase/epimerase family protein n=1 Tax=Methanosarcina sp. TaxID=2213 RepID=UPI0026290914|nr:TIM barrel protein [Methanosarcina sp.]MDD3246144.1 TIM barrel protein [Methanosarcina sp.]